MAPNYQAIAAQDARRYGIPVNVFLRQIQQESGFNPNARSSAGALGIAQFMPGTARAHGLQNPLDPVAALDAAARFDAQLFGRYGVAGGLSAYNSGRADAYKDPHFAGGQTYNYVKSIMGGQTPPPSQPQTGAQPGAPQPQAPAAPQVDLGALRKQIGMALINASQQGGSADFSPVFGLIQKERAAQAAPKPVQTVQATPAPVAPAAQPAGSTLKQLLPFATRYGLTVTSTTGGQHAPHSYHYEGRAVDYGGNPAHMAALYSYALAHPAQFKEAFYTGPGAAPYFVKNGQVYPINQLDPKLRTEHENHVHLAR